MKQASFYVSIALLLLTTGGVYAMTLRPKMAVLETRLEKLPLEMNQWRGEELRMDDSVFKGLNADKNVFRNYVSQRQGILNLYVGYYGTMRGGRASHMPQYCYTGQGWSIEHWETTTIELDPAKNPVVINKMLVKKEGARQLVLFWTQSFDQRVMTDGLELNLHKLKNRLLNNRNDGAFVRLSTMIDQDDVEGAFLKLSSFAKILFPLLVEYWPVEGPSSEFDKKPSASVQRTE